MVAEKTTTIYVELSIGSKTYAGDVAISTDGDHIVDLSNILSDGNARALICGVDCGYVADLLKCKALWLAGYRDNLGKCDYTNIICNKDSLVITKNGGLCFKPLTLKFKDNYYYLGNCETHNLRTDENDIETITAPRSYWNDFDYCYDCGCYVPHQLYYGIDSCIYCHNKNPIDDYCNSHHLTPVLYGVPETTRIQDFSGFGFELEIEDGEKTKTEHQAVARSICQESGLANRELRFAWDGSVSKGFEIISQPHTAKDFWNKIQNWERLLDNLTKKGYISHNSGCCGLHIHVSRNMLGKSEETQNIAIAKIFTFFDENWNDLVKISRRNNLEYCDKNNLSNYYDDCHKTKYKRWLKQSKRAGNHGRALNNTNRYTFEYRLGRGTLNKWSFFAWIDLVLTITKNAKRITAGKVESNDLLSWLAGISETTAKYIYKRNAFKREMLELYPCIAWEVDTADN